MTAQGSAYSRFKRAIQRKNLLGAEMTLREMGGVGLLEALDYLVLLAELRPERAPSAAIRWHGRLELEAASLTLSESQLALAALASLLRGRPRGGRDSPPACPHRTPDTPPATGISERSRLLLIRLPSVHAVRGVAGRGDAEGYSACSRHI
jgi:hypothetical protein